MTTRDELMAHIADQKRRYQTVSLSHEQADALVRLTASAPGEQQPRAWRWRYRCGPADQKWNLSDEPVTQEPGKELYYVEPLYTSVPPAPGWDEAIEAAAKHIETRVGYVHGRQEIAADIRALRREAPASSGVAVSNLDAEVAALAHRFWSIHPSSLDDMGLTREQFYAQEMARLIKAVRG